MLIDSHILLWLLQEPHKIKPAVRSDMRSADEICVSVATLWELGLKHKKGKLDFSAKELRGAVLRLGFKLLPIEALHVVAATTLKTKHLDPFDSLLVAQAKTEGLLFITADQAVLGFGFNYIVDAGS